MIRCLFAVAVLLPVWTVRADDPPPLLSAKSLRAELGETLPVVRWSGVPFRTAVRRLTRPEGIAVVLDRRIDPSRTISFEATGRTIGDVLDGLATDAGGEYRIVGGTVFLGPPSATGPLRTLVRLRTDEALERFDGTDAAVASRRRTVRWEDFATPAEVLGSIDATYGVRIEGTDAIPYDLWSAGAISDATFAEAVSLVLIQFDKSFAWGDSGDDGVVVRIVPVPERVGVEETYPVPREASVLADWQRRFPEATFERTGRRVRVVALVEEHEFIAGGGTDDEPRKPAPPAEEPSPLDRQRFTLKLEGVPVAALMATLEKQTGVIFSHDADVLRKAGVDLQQRIDVDARDATLDEFLESMLAPVKVDFEREDRTIRLFPKRG